MVALHDMLEQIDLRGTYRTFQPKQHNTDSFQVHVERFPEHNTFETSNQLREKLGEKSTNTWKLNNMLINNQWIKEKNQKSTLKQMKIEIQ